MRNSARALFLAGSLVLLATPLAAHCDALDGPVVVAARKAIEKGEVDRVLVWVRKVDEGDVRRAFERTLAVRSLGPAARELADTYFFETLVRIHRAGEGAAFTGLKPAGQNLGPAIPAADRALETGDLEGVKKVIRAALVPGLEKRFAAARAKAGSGVEEGRHAVHAYVDFLHYVDGVHRAVSAGGKAAEAEPVAHGHEH